MGHLVIATSLLMLAAVSGCGSSNADTNQANDDTHGHGHHHHDNLHKPVDYQSAMSRLSKLHQAILAGRRFLMPDHRRATHTHHHHHGDGHAHLHERVDAFKEMHDIAKWLPELAADSDLPKDPWDKINEHSKKLVALLDEVGTENQAENYEARRKSVVGLLAKLKTLVPKEP